MVGCFRYMLYRFYAVSLASMLLGTGPLMAAPMIAVGDALQIDFLDDDADPIILDVGGDGAVQLPFVGAVAVAGYDLETARDQIEDLYVARDIYLAPQIELSFLAMRPLSVLGDVREPGQYDYQAFVTVEQAIGLAGGVLRLGQSEEGRAMQRATLFGELARIEGEMVREAVTAARLNTQLQDDSDILAADVVVADLPAPDRALIDTLVMQDNAIIAAELDYFGSENTLLTQAVTDAQLQIALTQDQIVAQEEQIASYDAELENTADLVQRGLVPAPVRAQLLRQVSDEKTDLLRLRTNIASARLQLISLERQKLDLDYQRRQSWRLALADVAVRAAQLRGAREAVLDRIAVLENWSVRAGENDVAFSYVIRRRLPGGETQTITAAATDELSAGDVLVVTIAHDDVQTTAQVQP